MPGPDPEAVNATFLYDCVTVCMPYLCLCVILHACCYAYVSANMPISMPMCQPTCAFSCLFFSLHVYCQCCGSGLNIQDPQHCLLLCLCVSLHAHFHAYVSASVCIYMPMCKPTCAFLCLFVILPARLHAKLHTGTFLQCCGTGTDRTVIFALVEP
jgi:hypothetical protein